jgi:alpha-beta hydrolase superfamily lysophospholipase
MGVAPKATSVLLCNPFAQEALRAQRMFRMLAERLARNGFHVLRFDYFGTGDSDGDCEDGQFDAWTQDILAAAHEASERSRTTRSAWVGLGLGASLAARASLRWTRPLSTLVLWEPLLDGHRYLEQMGKMHSKHFSRRVEGLTRIVPGPAGAAAPADVTLVDQLLGFPITAELRRDFDELARPLPGAARADRVVVLTNPGDNTMKNAVTSWLGTPPRLDVSSVPPWSSTSFDDIVASGVVYTEVINVVERACDAIR